MIGTYALSAGYYDAYYLKAQKTRHLISNDFKEAFKKVDVIMRPVSPSTAFDVSSFKDPVSTVQRCPKRTPSILDRLDEHSHGATM
jgi:aspartyl-tRNA(Asn)/glutamyl-tRNA(Gln) amidotransferase subunit A